MMRIYRAKLKSRKQIMAEIPREQQGWWADVCPGETLRLRDATEADLARCIINEGQSRDPADYLCETFERGCLVKRIAIEALTPLKNCHTCRNLAWHDDDTDGFSGVNGGYGCDKRDPGSPAAEKVMLADLAREDYRNRYKRCYEPQVLDA